MGEGRGGGGDNKRGRETGKKEKEVWGWGEVEGEQNAHWKQKYKPPRMTPVTGPLLRTRSGDLSGKDLGFPASQAHSLQETGR